MRIYLVLVLCLAGAACGRSVQEVENLLETLREALETVEDREYEETQNKAPITIWDRRAEGETETVKVSENGVVFAETISFDDEHQCETLHVPAHNGRAEVDIRHCFKEKEPSQDTTGMSMYCLTKNSRCYLLRLAEEGEPGLKEQEKGVEQFESKDNPVLDATGIEVHANRWVVTGVADRSKLPEVLASFKPDFKVFFADHLGDDAVILTDDGGDETDDKRNLIQGCPNGGIPRPMYAVSSPAGCEYLVFCPRDSSGNAQCPRRHVTDTFFMTCLCCPGVTDRHKCLYCNNLNCNFDQGTGVC
ncbi:uncharacterized protein LOC144920153 [Branchiostoma floridae x Branchiostoma belcheri]